MYNIIADLHTHTNACSHAYSTIAEMIHGAKNKGLYAIAITEHGPVMPGGPGPWFFKNLCALPLYQEGVKFITGMEANILDFEGNIDYEEIDNVDFLIASAHTIDTVNLENPTIEKCTQMYLNLAKNPYVHAIGHSGSPRYKYDYEKVIPVFKANNKLVEINSHTFDVRADGVENCREIARICKEHEVKIIVSSDAHYHTEVGNFTKALELLEAIDFPEELIVNSSVERLEAYLNEFTNINKNRKN